MQWREGSNTARQWWASMRDHVFPHIGGKTVAEVTTADCHGDAAADLDEQARSPRGGSASASAPSCGGPSRRATGRTTRPATRSRRRCRNGSTPVQHGAALPHHEVAVAAAVAAVRNADAWVGTRLAFEFLVLTAARSAEVRLATWGEMDLVAMVWTVPGRRMKAKRAHRVPLHGRAVEVLREAERLRGAGDDAVDEALVFPAVRGGALDAAALSKLVRRLGIAAVPHGFRSSFRDWAAERTNHPREVVEAALAHVVRNQTEAAYARSDLFERRRHLMEDWEQYLEVVRGQVVPCAAGETAGARAEGG